MPYKDKKALLAEQEAVQKLLESDRMMCRFPSHLEHAYQTDCRHRVRHRLPVVGVSVVVFMLIFVFLDFYMLPLYLVQETFVLRVFVVVPLVIVVCSWLYFKMPKYYLLPYGLVFMVGSLSVVWIIWRAHSLGVLLPYEGLMITMMYGFVVMGLPFVMACTLNGITVLAYALTEPFYVLSFPTYLNNLLFLGAMYLAGMVSAWILSKSQRNQFLQQALLNIKEELALLSLQAKNRYIAVASHDLRQPLQSILMTSEELKKQKDDPTIERMYLASQSLSNMFDQLLDATRIQLDTVKIDKQPIALSSFFKAIVLPWQVSARNHGIELHVANSSNWVLSDLSALQRIVNNLIQNAINHSQCRHIWVNAYEWQDSVVLEVKDDGTGIEIEEQASMFNEFTRGNGQSASTGLGVGLSIVKQLSEKLGHHLSLSSDQGCTFRLTLEKCEEINQSTSSKTVLLVEDETDVLHSYRQWFENWGWHTFIAGSIEKAKHYLQEHPDVILTDWQLRDGEGGDLLTLVEGMEDYHPGCWVVSGNVDAITAAKPHWHILEKPMTASRLRASLQHHLN